MVNKYGNEATQDGRAVGTERLEMHPQHSKFCSMGPFTLSALSQFLYSCDENT
jgi:hypothetical protein